MKSLEKSNHRAEKKKAAGEWGAVSTLGNKTKATKEHRKHQQAEKKKKKKKKQRQKEKLKIKEEKDTEKLKVKGKEEIRREELEKAGVLAPTNALFKGNEEGKTSKISKESSPVKSYWTKSSKNSSQPKIKGNSLHELDSPSDREKSQSDPSTPESKGGEDKDWPNRKFQKEGFDHMSSIDSAIAYLSEPKQSIEVDTMKTFGKSNNIPQGNERTPSPLETIKSRESWPKPPVPWHHNRQNLFGSVSTSKIEGNNEHKHNRKQDVWAKHLADPETNFREVESNDLLRMSQLSQPLEKNIPSSKTYDWKPSRPEVNNWTSLKSMNPKEERRYYSGEPVYNSPNTGWPRFSVESLKHGNLVGNVKTWPEVPIDQSMGTNNEGYSRDRTPENWSTIPLESKQSKLKIPTTYTWPNFSDDSTNHNSIISGKVNAWSKPFDSSKQRDMVSNTWPQNLPPHQKPISAIDTAIAHHSKEASNNKQWPHFAYHRVTSSPQILAQQQKEAQQRARHRNAYIAVSVIAPPGKSKALGKSQNRTNASSHAQVKIKVEEPPVKPSASPLPDKMDQLLSMRSEKQKLPERGDLLEEELVDMAVEGQQQRAALPWSHARHLDKIQEQLKTLSAMGEKLRYHWLEKERLMQILRDGGKSGSGFFRPQRDGSTGQKTETTATTTNPPNLSITPHTTHAPPAP